MKLLNNSTIKLCYTLPILPVSERIINVRVYTLISVKCIPEQIKTPKFNLTNTVNVINFV